MCNSADPRPALSKQPRAVGTASRGTVGCETSSRRPRAGRIHPFAKRLNLSGDQSPAIKDTSRTRRRNRSDGSNRARRSGQSAARPSVASNYVHGALTALIACVASRVVITRASPVAGAAICPAGIVSCRQIRPRTDPRLDASSITVPRTTTDCRTFNADVQTPSVTAMMRASSVNSYETVRACMARDAGRPVPLLLW